jgi:hypothetical protein
MKDFTPRSVEAKVINSPEYQEYLEYLEEEAMSKNPDDFCFEVASRESYSKEDLNVFQFMNVNEENCLVAESYYFEDMRIVSAAI